MNVQKLQVWDFSEIVLQVNGQILYLHCCAKIASSLSLQSAVPLLMLQTGISIACKSSGKVLCKVQPPVKCVATIPLDAVANAILPSDPIFAIWLIKKVLPVPSHINGNGAELSAG